MLNENLPLVSVIIPTFKRSEMLERAIDSVLNQIYKNIEVIIVDDNDPNSEWREITSSKMLKYENDSRVIYIKHEKNKNGSVARNTGILNANGEIVTFLDDDDIYYDNKIEKQVDYLLSNPQFQGVYCGWKRMNSVIPVKEGDLSYDILSGDNIIYTNAIMMWKDAAIKSGGFDITFKRHQEASLLVRFFNKGYKMGVVSEILVEFDVSDRGNAAGNAQINEQQTLHYINTFKETIDAIGKKKYFKKKKIFLHRYRGILLYYLKLRDYKGAISFYFRKCIRYFVTFPFSVLLYTIRKIVK